MRGLPHIAENFKIEIFEARFLNCSDPIYADPKFGHQMDDILSLFSFNTVLFRQIVSRSWKLRRRPSWSHVHCSKGVVWDQFQWLVAGGVRVDVLCTSWRHSSSRRRLSGTSP